jgi:hypothetical protein
MTFTPLARPAYSVDTEQAWRRTSFGKPLCEAKPVETRLDLDNRICPQAHYYRHPTLSFWRF